MVVYRIINIITGKIYIGSTVNFEVRKFEHLGHFRNKSHANYKMQHDFNKYGASSFVFDIIKDGFSNDKEMRDYEYSLIDALKKEDYNIDRTYSPVFKKSKNKSKFVSSSKGTFILPPKHINQGSQKNKKQIPIAKPRVKKIKAKNIGIVTTPAQILERKNNRKNLNN